MRSRLSTSFGALGKVDIVFFDSEKRRWSQVVGCWHILNICCDSLTTTAPRLLSAPYVFRFSSQTTHPERFSSRTRSVYAPCQDRVRPVRPGVRLRRW